LLGYMGWLGSSQVTPEQSYDIMCIQLCLETGWEWEYVRALPLPTLGKFVGYRNGMIRGQQDKLDG
jgi:hypothetical protein